MIVFLLWLLLLRADLPLYTPRQPSRLEHRVGMELVVIWPHFGVHEVHELSHAVLAANFVRDVRKGDERCEIELCTVYSHKPFELLDQGVGAIVPVALTEQFCLLDGVHR